MLLSYFIVVYEDPGRLWDLLTDLNGHACALREGDTGLDKVILGLQLGHHHMSAVHEQLDHEQLDWFPHRQL